MVRSRVENVFIEAVPEPICDRRPEFYAKLVPGAGRS